jgi:hypothetical protein
MLLLLDQSTQRFFYVNNFFIIIIIINIKKRCVDWSNNNNITIIFINILLNITYAGCTTILKSSYCQYQPRASWHELAQHFPSGL